MTWECSVWDTSIFRVTRLLWNWNQNILYFSLPGDNAFHLYETVDIQALVSNLNPFFSGEISSGPFQISFPELANEGFFFKTKNGNILYKLKGTFLSVTKLCISVVPNFFYFGGLARCVGVCVWVAGSHAHRSCEWSSRAPVWNRPQSGQGPGVGDPCSTSNVQTKISTAQNPQSVCF